MPLTRRAALAGLACLTALPAQAAPRRYVLDTAGSEVGFQFIMSGLPTPGSNPILRADILLDTNRLEASTVDVELDAQGAYTPAPFALDALRSPLVLGVDEFPRIRFKSRRVQLGPDGRISGGAKITGDLTLRDITRPITLDAALYRAPGSAVDDLERLSAQLTGSLSRAAFGATGYAQLVADTVTLDIRAKIRGV